MNIFYSRNEKVAFPLLDTHDRPILVFWLRVRRWLIQFVTHYCCNKSYECFFCNGDWQCHREHGV